jgi:hypothetical protein
VVTPETIDTPSLLLFCPGQGGWHSGIWFYGKWLAYIDDSIILHPTHWMTAPRDPDEAHRRKAA